MPIKCLYCDEDYHKNSSLAHILFSKDLLCEKCRKQLVLKHRYLKVDEFQVEVFYEYDEFFRSLILQYKECYDEALYPIFFKELKLYLETKYHDYSIVWIPSSKSKLEARGFDHMEKMLSILKIKKCNALYQSLDLDQKNKSFKERLKITESIKIKDEFKVPEKVLLIDDVVTSGASITAGAKILQKYTKKLVIVALSFTKERKM